MAQPTASYEDRLFDVARDDPRVVVLTAENRAHIRSLPERLGSRFIDVGIAEQTLVGVCAGLALRGRRPVAHALAAFLTMRAYEFIRTDVGIPGFPVKLVGFVPGFLSEANGPTHQAIEDVALMRTIPGMGIFCPADLGELVAGLPAVMASDRPFYIRYTGLAADGPRPPFDPGRAETTGDGRVVVILTYGLLTPRALQARAILEAAGIGCRVVNLRTLAPLDTDALDAALAPETGLVVTLEDHYRSGGLYTLVAERMADRGGGSPVLPLALDQRFFAPAPLARLLELEGFTGPAIAERIRHRLGR